MRTRPTRTALQIASSELLAVILGRLRLSAEVAKIEWRSKPWPNKSVRPVECSACPLTRRNRAHQSQFGRRAFAAPPRTQLGRFSLADGFVGCRYSRIVEAVFVVEEHGDWFLVSQHVNQMLQLIVMIVEGVEVGRYFLCWWKIGGRIFHKPNGAGFSCCSFENQIGLSG